MIARLHKPPDSEVPARLGSAESRRVRPSARLLPFWRSYANRTPNQNVILFLSVPVLRPVYGTVFILVIVTGLATITISTQMVKSALRQLGSELEEGSRSAGATWLYTARRIVLPLIAPTIAVVGILAFSNAARATGSVALLSNPSNRPLSVYQLNLMAELKLETASVVGVLILAITVGVGMIAIFTSFRARGAD